MGSVVSQIANLIQGLFSKVKEAKVLMIGLDASGKTTILYKMKLDENITTIPTIGFNVETFKVGGVSFTSWDVGGEDKIRSLWRHYYENLDACTYIIDSNDIERMNEAWEEVYNRIILEPTLKGITIMFFLNKQDLPNAINGPEFIEKYKLHERLDPSNGNVKHWYVVETVAITGDGLTEAFEILALALGGGGGTSTDDEDKNDKPLPSGYYGKNRLTMVYRYLGWSVHRHLLFPKHYQDIVWSLLLVSLKGGVKEGDEENVEEIYNRNKYWKNIYIPPEIITKIMSYIPVERVDTLEMARLNEILEKYKDSKFKKEYNFSPFVLIKDGGGGKTKKDGYEEEEEF